MRRTGTTLFFAVILCIPLVAWAQYFAIVSDSHVGARDSEYSKIIQRIEAEDIRLILHAGDAINGAGNVKLWKRFFELTGSGKTLHVAAGNHDINDAKSAQVFLKHFQGLYYSFSEGDTLFIILNTEIPGQSGRVMGEQLAWLTDELDRSFRYKFVFLHRPLYPIVRLHGLDVYSEARDDLHRLFVQKKVSLVVSGHDHVYRRTVRDKVVYVIAPRSRVLSGIFINDGRPGYIVVKRNKNGYSFVVKNESGGMQDSFILRK
jgi:3',5'-cyclic AMP phosphodiesterase CpdA